MICVEPRYFFSLNKTCRYCPSCDLIIAKKAELEQLLCAICEKNLPHIIGNTYTVFGTMDRKDWRCGLNQPFNPKEGMDRAYVFKGVLDFEPAHYGWAPDPSR